MTLETAKRILEELPQDKSDRFNYRMKNYTLVHEAEAVCRGGFTYCEHEGDRGRVYLWIKVSPTATDEESSIELALKKHQKKKLPLKNNIQEELSDSAPKPQQRTPPTPPDTASEDNEAAPLYRLASIIKRKLDEFVKIMDDLVDE